MHNLFKYLYIVLFQIEWNSFQNSGNKERAWTHKPQIGELYSVPPFFIVLMQYARSMSGPNISQF